MANLPIKFRKSSDASVSYDYNDIASGTGFETFYLMLTCDLSILTPITSYSEFIATETASSNSGSYVKLHDLDFDVEFVLPKDIKGTAILNVPHGYRSGYSDWACWSYLIVTLRKWDGSTETDIVTNTGNTITGSSAAGTSNFTIHQDAIDLVVPLTHFKAGETLRITVEQWVKTNGTSAEFVVGHDPKNRATGTTTNGGSIDFRTTPSLALIQVPFKVYL